MSELYVCKQFETPYERVCKIITTLEEHDEEIRADERAKVLDEVEKTVKRMYPPLTVDLMKALKKL